MLNKEDILALAWEYSEGSGKRYTFTEESLLEMMWAALSNQNSNEVASLAQDEREAKVWPNVAGIGRDSEHPRAVVLYLRHEPSDEHLRTIQDVLRTRPAQTEQQPIAFVDGDEVKRFLRWSPDVAAFDFAIGAPVYAAIPA